MRLYISLLVVLAFLLVGCPPTKPDPKPTGGPVVVASPVAMPEGVIYGVTVDSTDHLGDTVEALSRLRRRVMVRLVFDYPEQPSNYVEAVTKISAVADIVGQPSDSVYAKKMSVSQYRARFEAYVKAFPQISLWEAANEANGDWAGENVPAQTDAAFDVIKAAGKRVLFTPYWNSPGCEDKHGNWLAWTEKNISAKVKAGTDLVAVSIYGKDCEGPEPTQAEIQGFTDKLGTMFPIASIGIGEFGSDKSQSDSERVLRYYMGLRINHPRWVFFGGWWYFPGYAVPSSKPLWSVLNSLM